MKSFLKDLFLLFQINSTYIVIPTPAYENGFSMPSYFALLFVDKTTNWWISESNSHFEKK